MKILFLLPNNILGGAEQYLKMVAEHYKSEDVEIVFFRKLESSLWENLNTYTNQKYMSSKNETIGILKYFFKILFKRNSYDYIFTSHVSVNAFVGIMLSLNILKTQKFIARESTTVFTRFTGIKLAKYEFLYEFGYRKIDLLICQTELMKNQLIEYFPKINKRTIVEEIPNPIDKSQIEFMSKGEAKIKLPKEYLVSAGRLIQLKGFDLLINSLAKLKASYPDLKLLILGKGNLKETLKLQAESLGLKNDVVFVGHVSNVYPYFKNAQACVVSSRIEGFPNVLLQMMSQNNNVISTTCAGGIDKIPNITTVEVDNAEKLYNGILKVLENPINSTQNIHKEFLNKRDISSFIKRINEIITPEKVDITN
ncbi:glycosyltransferase [Winogradskyella litoriviva]|uniref:Glycosyltransferase n=1 Tax=Winogradskyella litoriviva TaxID=1220182 RepID=A0ABX2E573_9FLAO|nr:glycosyltransferase [Winogradskyella litoriviva]NRD23520.1 glycosyltransferase [Winogradskyella litoriviva]